MDRSEFLRRGAQLSGLLFLPGLLPRRRRAPEPIAALSSSPGVWAGATAGYNFQWKIQNADGSYSDIVNATESTYALRPCDEGRRIRCVATPKAA